MAPPAKIREVGTDGVTYEVATPASQPGDVFPAGSVLLWSGSAAPTGWALVKGQTLSRTTYPNTFANCTMCGSGDGSTTFTLPNMDDQVPVGASASRALGSRGGEDTHAVAVAELPVHNHVFNGNALPGHAHTLSIDGTGLGLINSISGSPPNTIAGAVSGVTNGSSPSHTHTGSALAASAGTPSGTISTTGSGSPLSLMQPYVAWNYIIRLY